MMRIKMILQNITYCRFFKFCKKDGNDSYYDTSIYIDGRMEASFSSLFNAPLIVKQLQINPVNVYINTIDVDYLPVSDIGENGDYDVYQYYLKYRYEIICEQSEQFQQELILKQYLKKFNVGTMVELLQTVQQLAILLQIRQLLFLL